MTSRDDTNGDDLLEILQFAQKRTWLLSWRDPSPDDDCFAAGRGFSHDMIQVVTTFLRFFNLHRRGHGFCHGMSHPMTMTQLPSWGDRTHDMPTFDYFGISF